MPMISYAQNQEDVLLRRVFPKSDDGFYIDVGANDPVLDSVTKHFHDRGWRGINIEPGLRCYEKLVLGRENDINLNLALSNLEQTSEFIEFPANTAMSTFSVDLAERSREMGLVPSTRTVPVTTLAKVCESHVDGTIDFLKIDVEGHEREVIEGADWVRWRPRVVLVEATWPEQWEHLLLAADYIFAKFDGLNNY